MFERLTEDIFRLRVPFADNWTGVFLIRCGAEDLLIDCATTAADVSDCILPALDALGARPSALLISHDHGDHSGGLEALRSALPEMRVLMRKPRGGALPIRDGDAFGSCVTALALPGHSDDSAAFLDRRTASVVTCDCVQLHGVSRWGTGFSSLTDYLGSLARLTALVEEGRIENLFAAHPYVSADGRDCPEARGRESALAYIRQSADIARDMAAFARETGGEPAALAEAWREKNRAAIPNLPVPQPYTFAAILREGEIVNGFSENI